MIKLEKFLQIVKKTVLVPCSIQILMKIKRLELKNYRNLGSVELVFPSIKTLIIGKNAQGKTNILESIYFLSDLKSPRTSTVSDLIKFGEEKFEIEADIEKNNTDIELDFSYDTEKKREIKINKVKARVKDFKSVIKNSTFFNKRFTTFKRNSSR